MDSAGNLRASVCPLDCPDTCSLSVEVSGNQIVGVRGSMANPYTGGVICEKVAKHYPTFVHGAERLQRPLRRIGSRGSSEFEPISWDEALDLVHEGIERVVNRYGPESVLPLNYAGPHGKLAGGSMDRRFFHRLGATLLDRGPLCGAVRGAAYASLFGSSPGMPPEQAAHADLIAVWGNNVTVSNLHLARVIKAAREKGATLVVVDPKRTRIAEQAHIHVQLRPGTDVVLALGLAAELERRGAVERAFVERWVSGFEPFMDEARRYSAEETLRLCGITADTFERLVEAYRHARTIALSIGNGIERARSGGAGLRAAMGVLAITGHFGRRGAGVIAKPGGAFPSTPDRLERPDLMPGPRRTVNIVDVARHILDDALDPPIRAVFIYNHNPVCTHPDQNRMIRALSREDVFVVGADVVMTDSMRYTDVVLPAASHFEINDIYASYGHTYLQRAEPVIPPVGESLPNTEIFRRLADRFDFDDAAFRDSDAALMDSAFDLADPRLGGQRPSLLPLGRALPMHTKEGEELIMCDTVEPATPSGKIELYCGDLEVRFGCGVPRYQALEGDYPFMLISPSSKKRTNATFGNAPACQGPEIVEIHPEDAARKNIQNGATVRVWNALGEVSLKARLSDAIRKGVLYSPKGTWLGTSSTGRTLNALISGDAKSDIMDGACYNDTFADIETTQAGDWD